MKFSAILFGLIAAGTLSMADAAIGAIKHECGDVVKVEMLRTKVKQDAKPTKVKDEAYHALEKRAETETEPEPTPVEGAEGGPDECPCGHCGKGSKPAAT